MKQYKEGRKIILIILGLFAFQLLRIGAKTLMFLLIERTLVADTIFNIIIMGAAVFPILVITKRKGYDLSIMPKRFSVWYIVATVFVALLFTLTLVLFTEGTVYGVLFLIYGALVTPFFEETVFRGVVWSAVRIKNNLSSYIASTLLFAVWHLGYIDTVIWRTSLFFPDADIFKIVMMKVVTGFIIGMILGAVRYKTKNVYASMLLHCLINTVGG